jgi:magnesium-transporting ATPase (P-type)
MDFELAITGPAFGKLMLLHRAGVRAPLECVTKLGRVFARMSPEQKQALVETYGDGHGLIVGMCGDGANDCGALKAAHVGLSLSEAEASIAAPFTSSTPNIGPLVTLMREGRAALVTSVSCFKFMALYSVIQFVTVLRLYQVNTNMSDMQYLWIDLCIIFPLAVTMGRTGAYKTLSRHTPNGRLISFPVLASVLGQALIAACFQAFAAWWTFQVRRFECNDACPSIMYTPSSNATLAAPSVASIAAAGGTAVPWLGVMGLVGAGFSGEGGRGVVSELMSTPPRRGLGLESGGRGERVVVVESVGRGGGLEAGGGMEEGEVCNNALGYLMPRCCFLLPLGTMLLTLV